jgi:hypothetical protein
MEIPIKQSAAAPPLDAPELSELLRRLVAAYDPERVGCKRPFPNRRLWAGEQPYAAIVPAHQFQAAPALFCRRQDYPNCRLG